MALAVGRRWAYYIVSLTITLVLALAANTSFGGLPVLTSLLARDNYVPHLFALRGTARPSVRHRRALRDGRRAAGRRARQHEHAHPALRHRGLHRVHALPDRSGRALAAPAPASLAVPRRRQRDRCGHHGRGHDRLPGVQVHRGRLGGRRGRSRVDPPVPADRRLLRPGRGRARHRPDTPEAHRQAHHRDRAGEPPVPADRARPDRGQVTRAGDHRRDGRPRDG